MSNWQLCDPVYTVTAANLSGGIADVQAGSKVIRTSSVRDVIAIKEKTGMPVIGLIKRYASTTALVQMASAYNPELDNGRKIFENLDDPKVMEILDRWVDEIMLGLSSLTHIFNPSCIILGGGIMVQPLIMEKIREKKERFIMPSFCHVDIRPAELGNSAGLLGACHLAMQYIQAV